MESLPLTNGGRYDILLKHGTCNVDRCHRNFLLFLPAQQPGLRAVFSYYNSTLTVNPEGDVHVSDETVQGLGIGRKFLTSLFGTLVAALQPPRERSLSLPPVDQSPSQPHISANSSSISRQHQPDQLHLNTFPWDPGDQDIIKMQSLQAPIESPPSPSQLLPQTIFSHHAIAAPRNKPLTDLLPPPGYFIAGGIAGVASRTLTAPLDRLKVYLIAQTGVRDETVQAVKQGAPVQAAKVAARPLRDAMMTLWQMGGLRSLFAGWSYAHMNGAWLTSTGNGLNVVKVMPESAVKFGSYEVLQYAGIA